MTKLIAICALLTLVACGKSADNNDTNNDTTTANNESNNQPNNETDMGGGGEDAAGPNNTTTVSFTLDVVTMLGRSGCIAAGCHLAPGNGTSFVIEAPGTPLDYEAALENVSTAGGRALVAPGDLANSELYLRVTGDGVARMPFGGTLAPADIELIETWIMEGAVYDSSL